MKKNYSHSVLLTRAWPLKLMLSIELSKSRQCAYDSFSKNALSHMESGIRLYSLQISSSMKQAEPRAV